jgi:hypothetical protein
VLNRTPENGLDRVFHCVSTRADDLRSVNLGHMFHADVAKGRVEPGRWHLAEASTTRVSSTIIRELISSAIARNQSIQAMLSASGDVDLYVALLIELCWREAPSSARTDRL